MKNSISNSDLTIETEQCRYFLNVPKQNKLQKIQRTPASKLIKDKIWHLHYPDIINVCSLKHNFKRNIVLV